VVRVRRRGRTMARDAAAAVREPTLQ